jgi:formylglycine-generating enzyme
MSDFDPYHKWLGIPETERPISKYRLLALVDFEIDRGVISTAAERQTVFLRTLQAGEHAVLVAELLNEVSQARVTLLNAEQKAEYDEGLREQQTPEPEPEPTPPPIPVVQTPTPAPTPVLVRGTVTQEFPVSVVQPAKRPRRRQPKKIWKRPAFIGVFLVGVIGILAHFMNLDVLQNADPVARNSPPVITLPPLPIAEPVPVPKLKPTPQRVVSEGGNNTVGYVAKPTPKSEPESVPATKPKVTPQKGFRNNAKGYAPTPTPQPELEPERQPEPAMKRLEVLRAILSGREALAKRDFDSAAESLIRVESFVLSTDLKGPYDRLKIMHKLVKSFDLKLRETLENLKPGNIIVLKEGPAEIKSIDPVEVLLENNGKSISYPRNDLPHDLILGLIEGSFQSQTHDDFFGFAAYIGTMKSEYKNDALNIWGLVSKQDNHYEPDALSIYLIDDSRLSITDVETEASNTLPASLQEGLIAYYPFNGNAEDESGHGNDGAVTGPVLTTDRFGFTQSAYQFDGVNDRIMWSNAVADSWFEGKTNFSSSLWIKPLVEESSRKKIFFEYGRSVFGLEGETGPGKHVYFFINNAGTTVLPTTLEVGEWNHLVLQIDGVNKQLYKNGVLARHVAFSDAIHEATSFTLGGREKQSDYCTHSEFDDIRIYNRALSAAEVKILYDFESKPSNQPIPTAPATESITNTIGMTLNKIPAGTFMMGSPEGEEGRQDNETQHKVTITKPFYMQTTEVTQGEWQEVMDTEPWKDKQFVKEGPNYAATYVSWDDAVAYCKKLSEKEGKTYRLPTEAEWEYACRAGTQTAWYFGDDEKNLGDYAWYRENAFDIGAKFAHEVGHKKSNAFGLYDMHGNVWEWCYDHFEVDYYKQQSPEKDPQGPAQGAFRVIRSGSWGDVVTSSSRSASRNKIDADSRNNSNVGFRLVRELD